MEMWRQWHQTRPAAIRPEVLGSAPGLCSASQRDRGETANVALISSIWPPKLFPSSRGFSVDGAVIGFGNSSTKNVVAAWLVAAVIGTACLGILTAFADGGAPGDLLRPLTHWSIPRNSGTPVDEDEMDWRLIPVEPRSAVMVADEPTT